MSIKKDHREPNLVKISTFARLKGVTRQAVRYQIMSMKTITPVYIGRDKDVYIDWEAYKNHKFDDTRAGAGQTRK